MLDDINEELNKKCPEVFDNSQINEISSEDIAEGFVPNEIQIDGQIEAEDAARYATTKQLLHMVMKRYERRYKVSYSISTSLSE
jgi:hypothetical protein